MNSKKLIVSIFILSMALSCWQIKSMETLQKENTNISNEIGSFYSVISIDTGELRKIPTRSLLRFEKNLPAERGLWPYQRPMTEEEERRDNKLP